jgi:hypothetical protein
MQCECSFIQPDNSLTVIVFVAIFSALVSTPIALGADWIIMHTLAASLSTVWRSKTCKRNSTVLQHASSMIIPDISSKITDMAVSTKQSTKRRSNLNILDVGAISRTLGYELFVDQSVVLKEMTLLTAGIKRYHQHIETDEERREFEGKT